jgi:ribosomal protein S18 acetylase RimI-like enzyme
VEACRAWYERRDLPPKITVPLPVRRDVASHLDAAGWVAQPTVLVQTAPVAALAAATTEPDRVELHERPTPAFLDHVGSWKQGLPPAAEHVLNGGRAVRFAHVRSPDGTLLASARGAVVDEDPDAATGPLPDDGAAPLAPDPRRWLHIGLVHVDPQARRQGLARATTIALASWAEALGASRAVLQVEERNEPAVRLYSGMGFTTHHTYVTYHR